MKKRYIFCISAIALIVVGYFIFLCTYSNKYTISLFLNGTVDVNAVSVECSDENVIKAGDIRQGNFDGLLNTLEIDISSAGRGDSFVKVSFDDVCDSKITDDNGTPHTRHITKHEDYEIAVHVLPFGMIWCTEYDDFNGLWTIKLLADALMIVLIITFSFSFLEKYREGRFSYSMVSLGGIIVFMTVTVYFSLYFMFSEMEYNKIASIKSILYSVSQINSVFANMTFIPFFLFCVALSISNIQLVRHEGFRIFNLLGFMLGIFAVAGIFLMYYIGNEYYRHSDTEQILMVVINSAVSFIFCYIECLLVSTILCAVMSTKYRIRQPVDYIIILGCAIRSDGSPTPILRGRIDRAIAFGKEQSEKWAKTVKYVPSGGQGSDEVISEAESMKRYLMEQGIPEDHILKEDKSVNTYQNFSFSKKVIEEDTGDAQDKTVAFSTTNYHVFRGYILSKKLGMNVRGLSARTKHYFYPNAFLREFIGLLAEQKKRHILFILLGIVFFASLYLIIMF